MNDNLDAKESHFFYNGRQNLLKTFLNTGDWLWKIISLKIYWMEHLLFIAV